MIRATAGNWANYATTLVAQVLFATHFGSGYDAAAFIVAFTIATSLSGVLVSVVQAVAIPRLITVSGDVRRDVVDFLTKMTVGATVVGLLYGVAAGPASAGIAGATGIPRSTLLPLLVVSAAVVLVRFVAGEIAAVAYALGHRLLPSLAPALPSSAMAVAFVVVPHIGVVAVFAVFLGVSVLEAALLALFVWPRTPTVSEPTRGVAGATIWLLCSGALLSLLPPTERILAGLHHGSDAARYDYGLRSLGAAQVLLTGGIAIAMLATWSRLATAGHRDQLGRAVAYTTLACGQVLVLSAAAFFVTGHDFVQLIYQHGQFTAADTDAVTQIVDFALLGYCAQGMSTLLISALSSIRHTRDMVATGVVQFSARLALAIPLGVLYGAKGVALSYSIGSALMLGAAIFMVVRAGLWTMSAASQWRFVGAAATTMTAAVGIAVIGKPWLVPARLSALVALFAIISFWMLRQPLSAEWPRMGTSRLIGWSGTAAVRLRCARRARSASSRVAPESRDVKESPPAPHRHD